MEPQLHVITRGSSSKLLLLNNCYILVVVLLCFVLSDSVPFPPKEEVDALREIADELHKRDWDFSLNPCDNNTNFVNPTGSKKFNNTVLCNCTAAECHVSHIILKGQDLSGVLPPSLAKLPHIAYFDVSQNYLNGSIPRQWASTKLQKLALAVNRLSGRIPDFLGNITTLTSLTLESNMFFGNVPASLGNLVNLETLFLSANNLSGEFPKELSGLTKLTVLRLTGNNFVGKLPNFSSWLNLQKV
ncbi:hypothetical protein LIER_40357 [Lithospermum erythrorhizon]|uniref:Uncharacterized protein n=1 Tax=Lithospermum erythrorhizon TaxID=34254 RepID=A0AAV3QXJ1_LITER